jgi:G6PDH family F420-dependent oxidoreductase
MMNGRFFLGVGTGENLNEHVHGDRWPEWDVRAEMLEEAVAVIRQLWEGDTRSHHGRHYTVENARIYTRPDEPPAVVVAASGSKSADLAGRIGDGLCVTTPNRDTVQGFVEAGGHGKPVYGQMTVCWAADEASAKATAHKLWAFSSLPGELSQELPMPAHFEQAVQIVTEEMVAETVVCGPDVDRHVARIREYAGVGVDHVYVHQVGPDQEGFLDFYKRNGLPRLS